MYEHHGDQMFDRNRDGSLDRREQVLKADYYSKLGNSSGSGKRYSKAGPLEYFFSAILMLFGVIALIGLPPVGAALIVAAKSMVE